jgi:Na+-transporting NADH:ubiquinone oxidoreductase subunit C
VQRSNLYIVVFTGILTIVCGALLAIAAEGLKPKQQENVELEKKKNILNSVMKLTGNEDIKAIYGARVKAYVVNTSGEVVDGVAEDINVQAEYKKADKSQRILPVYEILSETDPNTTEYYVFPLYGFGLWDNIWGYVSVKSDFNTIKGVIFDHKGETPGLGARITTPDIQDRYKDKELFNGDEFVSVIMMKGEGNDYSTEKNKVDGMSGATLTAKGINNMITEYISAYQPFIKSKKTKIIEVPVTAIVTDTLESDSTTVAIMSDSLKINN